MRFAVSNLQRVSRTTKSSTLTLRTTASITAKRPLLPSVRSKATVSLSSSKRGLVARPKLGSHSGSSSKSTPVARGKNEPNPLLDSSSQTVAPASRPLAKRNKATLSMEGQSSAAAPAVEQAARRQALRATLEEVLLKPRTLPIPRWITPRHKTITLSEVFGHSSFVLVASSYAVDDFLNLRIIAVAGSTVMLVFTYFHPYGKVLWLPFKWNLLFIAINSYRIGKVYWNKYQASRLSPELKLLFQQNFYLMDPVDFARLASISTLEDYRKGDVLIRQGEENTRIRVVVEGHLRVLRDGKLTYYLEPANFMSESGLHVGLLLSGGVTSCGTVVAADDKVRMLSWDRTELMELMELYPSVLRAFKATLSWDVIRKLKAQRSLVKSKDIEDTAEWTELRKQQTQHRYAAILENILTKNPSMLMAERKELNKYRMIHGVDDEHHMEALEAVGWTLAEFEAGHKNEHDIPELHWYWRTVNSFMHRIFS